MSDFKEYATNCEYFSAEIQTSNIAKSFINVALSLWKDRCDTLHGANAEEDKKIKKKISV